MVEIKLKIMPKDQSHGLGSKSKITLIYLPNVCSNEDSNQTTFYFLMKCF